MIYITIKVWFTGENIKRKTDEADIVRIYYAIQRTMYLINISKTKHSEIVWNMLSGLKNVNSDDKYHI